MKTKQTHRESYQKGTVSILSIKNVKLDTKSMMTKMNVLTSTNAKHIDVICVPVAKIPRALTAVNVMTDINPSDQGEYTLLL